MPIAGARVRAAIAWKGLSVNAAATRMRVSQQTLDSIVREKTERCYQSLRDKLAALFGLPAPWLGGETATLPTLTPWLPPPDLGYTPPFWVDENLQRFPTTGDITPGAVLPPRYQLAAYELWTEVSRAWHQDVERGNADAKAALAQVAVGRWTERPWDRAQMLVTRLVSAFWWRRFFLVPPPVPAPIDPARFTDTEWRALNEGMMLQNQRRAAEELAAADALAAAATGALTTTLGPWFRGERDLAYDRLVAVLEWAASGFGVQLSS